MKHRRTLTIASLLAAALTIPTVAYAADQKGDEGRAKAVEVLSTSSDSYVQYHGRVFIHAAKRTTEFRWGGTSCGSKTLSTAQVDLLVSAVRDRDEVKITPYYKAGQGSTKCLVGFALRNKAKTK